MTSDRTAPLSPSRRLMLIATVGALAAPRWSTAQHRAARASPVYFLAAVGPELTSFRVDAEASSLTRAGTITLPALVQYAWRHPRRALVYVAFSDFFPPNVGVRHGVAILHIGPDGALSEAFPPLVLEHRPIDVTTDPKGRVLLVAYSAPSGVTVHELAADGRPGTAVGQSASLDTGIYPHQVCVAPDGSTVILVARGNNPRGQKAEDPGALKTFRLVDGQLTQEHSVAPGGGYGFGPRHIDFHPSKPWVYVSVERENQLMMFPLKGGRLAEAPNFTKSTLADPAARPPVQETSAIHVSRDGRFVYLSNCASGTVEIDGRSVFAGGENSIAVFRIDPHTGEPTLVQSIGTQSFGPRTFDLDPTGAMLVSAAIQPMQVREGGQVNTVPAALSAFRIQPDGRLDFVRKYDIPTRRELMLWAGMIAA